jgi:hypothetical protein
MIEFKWILQMASLMGLNVVLISRTPSKLQQQVAEEISKSV